MKVVIAPDSFKESASAADVADALGRGIRAADPDAEIRSIPLSDGGEGFVEAMARAMDAEVVDVDVVDALGRPRTGRIAISGTTAVIESAEAVGLGLLDPADRSILDSDTRGLGMLIRAALDAGATELIIGIGGSATNDAGAGMLAELGVVYRDADGDPVGTTPRSLAAVDRIDTSGLDPRLRQVRIRVACDVNNPLLGERGSSAVYGPQKGATPELVVELDAILRRLVEVAGHLDGPALVPGAGAAGGLGYALVGFCGADLEPGIDIVADTVGLDEAIAGADLVVTGEGAIDAQTLMGKALSGVAEVCARHGVPLIAFAGTVKDDAEVLIDHGFTAIVPIGRGPRSLAEAMASTLDDLARAAESVARIFTASHRT